MKTPIGDFHCLQGRITSKYFQNLWVRPLEISTVCRQNLLWERKKAMGVCRLENQRKQVYFVVETNKAK